MLTRRATEREMMREQFDARCQNMKSNSEKITVFFYNNDGTLPEILMRLPVKSGPYEVGKLYRVTVEELAS